MYTYAYSVHLVQARTAASMAHISMINFLFHNDFVHSDGLFSSFTTSPIIWAKCMHWYIRMYTRFYNQNKLLLYKSYVSKTQLWSANPSKSADSQTQAHFLPSFFVCLAVCWSCFCLFCCWCCCFALHCYLACWLLLCRLMQLLWNSACCNCLLTLLHS